VTIRLPYPDGRLRELERLRGARRKLFRRYLSWVANQQLCGTHGEQVVLHSLQAAASRAGLFVPQQTPGNIDQIGPAKNNGTFDAYAYVLNTETIQQEAVIAVEVKNINSWIVPSSQELWQLLLNAAEVTNQIPVLPLLVCVRYLYPVLRMAQDLGFFVTALEKQLFATSIAEDEFDEVVDDMGLAIQRHDGPSQPVVTFFERTLRRNPLSPPPEKIEWFKRQVERFRAAAPLIQQYEVMSRDVDPLTRRRSFESFRARLPTVIGHPLVGGW
jgi:hypothetical protein